MSAPALPQPPSPRSLRVHREGLALHLLERQPSGPHRVLLLHGFLDHGHSFDWVAERLPGSFHTVAMDLRGMGASGHLGPGAHYHALDHLADVDAVLEALGWAQAHLVGHSLGGAVALAYAAARPERVRSVTSIEALGPLGGPPERAVERLRAFVEDAARPPRHRVHPSVEAAAARLREGVAGLSPEGALLLARHGTRPVEGGVVFTFDPRHHRRAAVGLDDAQARAVLSALSCPVQVLLGTEGYVPELAAVEDRLAALRHPPVHRVPGGHHCHLDSPDAVARLVAAFVAQAG